MLLILCVLGVGRILLQTVAGGLHSYCTGNETGAITTVSEVKAAGLPTSALESRTSFHFEVDVKNARVTLLAPASNVACQRFQGLAPSQFQANWKRSAGVIDGGDIAHMWMYELLPQWVDSVSNLPPVPIYIQTKYLLEQRQHHLPAFFGTFSSQDVTSMKIPLWEIYSQAEIVDPSDLRTRLIALDDPELSEFMIVHASWLPSSMSLEYTGLSSYGLMKIQWRSPTEDRATADCQPTEALYEATIKERSVISTGLTHHLHTKLSFNRPVPQGCEVTLHEFWPSNTFVDSEELKAAYQSPVPDMATTLIFPHFSEIELPTHLAAPTMMLIKWQVTNETSEFKTGPLLFHSRYNLPSHPSHPSIIGQFQLPNPRVTVKCYGIVSNIAIKEPDAQKMITVPDVVVGRQHLTLIAKMTAALCALSVLIVGNSVWKAM